MKTFLKIIIIIILVFILVRFFQNNDNLENGQWVAFYYSNKDNIDDKSTWEIKENLNSIEECRKWIDDTIGFNMNYDYECGYKCRYDGYFYICEETIK